MKNTTGTIGGVHEELDVKKKWRKMNEISLKPLVVVRRFEILFRFRRDKFIWPPTHTQFSSFST